MADAVDQQAALHLANCPSVVGQPVTDGHHIGGGLAVAKDEQIGPTAPAENGHRVLLALVGRRPVQYVVLVGVQPVGVEVVVEAVGDQHQAGRVEEAAVEEGEGHLARIRVKGGLNVGAVAVVEDQLRLDRLNVPGVGHGEQGDVLQLLQHGGALLVHLLEEALLLGANRIHHRLRFGVVSRPKERRR